MTLPEFLEQIAKRGCPEYAWYYDIRQMQNVTADDCKFPAIFMEEYYASRMVQRSYTQKRELTIELHFQQLVPMQGVALDREAVRDTLRETGTTKFVEAYNSYAAEAGLDAIQEWQDDPEPPMFDANATGVLLRLTLLFPKCYTFTHIDGDNAAEGRKMGLNETGI